MAKSTPTIVVGTTPLDLVLELVYQDFRGQKSTKRIALAGATTSAQVQAIVGNLDMITNARIVKASLLSSVPITGMNAAAQNALERNISEAMELTFQVPDPINTGKTISRSILVPAMIAGIELVDGSPDITNTNLAALVGTSGGAFADGALSGQLWWRDGGGSGHTAMNFVAGASHHITVADIVDTI